MTVLPAPETPADRARANERLRPYVPRLVISWLRDRPDAHYHEVEGSLAFVDISGFTALSERLARRGKIGAELMRDTLNDVFIALLDTAYDDGAGLLKWGGDALLLLFDGPDHESRACHACWEMQRTLDRVGRLKAGSATIVLRMSIGIHTGTFQFFLTGSVHRELLIAGPDATRTVTMEAIADAGEIAISPELAARLDPALVGPPKEESLLLVAPPEVGVRRAPDVGDVSRLDLPMCLPLAVRSHVMLERTEPEHRTITAAFIDLMDTDAQLERLGIDGLAHALDERIRTIQEVALRYEVPFYESDVGKSSVKALLTAGAPSTTGHDEERMLRALREIVDTPGEVQMRVGVNTGRVFTGDFGPSYRRSYRVFGDAINTAARVMSKAEAGQILATEIVLERSTTAFETTPIEPFAAKGKSEPVRASLVGPLLGRREAAAREVPFVGRERELEALLRVVEDARASKGTIVDLSGGPGLGKSRLVQDLLERAPDVFAFHTRCEEYESSTPYFPLRAPFRAVLGLSQTDGADVVAQRLRLAAENVDASIVPWVPLFGVLLGVEIPHTPETKALDERFIPERLADVMMRFLYTSLAGTTTMLVVEDAQHMDESSRELLRRLARAGVDRKQVLLVTHDGTGSLFAPEDAEDLHSLAFTLAPLSFQAAVDMVNAVTEDEPLPPHVVEELARRSAGSPLFLFELLDVVRRTGSVEALPDSVEAVVAAEIDRLSPADRTVLRYAAVLGTSVDPLLLAAALQGEAELDEGVWQRLGELLELDEAAGELRFRNALIRDAAYEGLPFRRRRVLHARVGEAIEATYGEEEVGALALHFSEAQQHEKAWRYCRLAGEKAHAIYSNLEAARFFERALKAAARVRGLSKHERSSTLQSLATVLERTGQFDAAFEALRRATRLVADDPIAAAWTFEQRSLARCRTGSYHQALRETARGLSLVSANQSDDARRAQASLLSLRADIRLQLGRPREAIELAHDAVRLAEATGQREALARLYSVLDGSYQMLGEPQKAIHELKALEILRDLGLLGRAAAVQTNLGVQAYADGRWEDAVDLYSRAHTGFLQTGDATQAALAGINLGELLVSRGALDEADDVLREARRALRSAHHPGAIFADIQLSRLDLARGDPGQAEERLRVASDEAARMGHGFLVLEAGINHAAALIAQGRATEALDVLQNAEEAGGEDAAYSEVAIRKTRGQALLALGHMDEADAELTTALDGARTQGMPFEEAQILEARAAVAAARGESAETEVQEARRLLHLLGVAR